MSDVVNEDVVTMKQFADMLVCEKKCLPDAEYSQEITMEFLGKVEMVDPVELKEPAERTKVVKRYAGRWLRLEHLIPPNSKTDPESILSDYAEFFSRQINRCVKDNGIKKLYLREVSFKHFKECISDWTIVYADVRISFGIDMDDESKLETPIDDYFQGLIHGK